MYTHVYADMYVRTHMNMRTHTHTHGRGDNMYCHIDEPQEHCAKRKNPVVRRRVSHFPTRGNEPSTPKLRAEGRALVDRSPRGGDKERQRAGGVQRVFCTMTESQRWMEL